MCTCRHAGWVQMLSQGEERQRLKGWEVQYHDRGLSYVTHRNIFKIKYLVANDTLFGYLFFNSYIGTVLRLMGSRFYTHRFAWGLLVVMSAGCGLFA